MYHKFYAFIFKHVYARELNIGNIFIFFCDFLFHLHFHC